MAGVIWDRVSGNFFDRDTHEPVSRKFAFESISYDDKVGQARDALGRFVPGWVLKEETVVERTLVSGAVGGQAKATSLLRYEMVSRELIESRSVARNEQVNVIITWRAPDGTVHKTTVSGGTGRRVDLDSLADIGKQKADADWRDYQNKSYRTGRDRAIAEINPYVISIEYQVLTIKTL